MQNSDLVWESGPKLRYPILILPILAFALVLLAESVSVLSSGLSLYRGLLAGFFGLIFAYSFVMELLPGTIAFLRSKPFIRFSEEGAKCGWKTYRWDGVRNFGNRNDDPRKLVFVDESKNVLFEIDLSSGDNDDDEGAEETLKRIISMVRKKRAEV